MLNNQTLLYITRSAALISWFLLSLSVVWGLIMSTKIVRDGSKKGWLLGVHRSLAGFAVIFTLVHVISLLMQTTLHYRVIDFLIPTVAQHHPVAASWGVISLWIILAIEITSLLKDRMSNNAWKFVHFLSFALFVTAAIHGYMAGPDTHKLIFLLVLAFISSCVLMLIIFRLAKIADVAPNDRTAAGHKARERKAEASAQTYSSPLSSSPEQSTQWSQEIPEPVQPPTPVVQPLREPPRAPTPPTPVPEPIVSAPEPESATSDQTHPGITKKKYSGYSELIHKTEKETPEQ